MENIYRIKKVIHNYYRVNKELSFGGGPTEDGEKYIEKVNIEKEILNYFGLPLTSKYIKLIWSIFDISENIDEVTSILLEELEKKSNEFKASKEKNMSSKLLEGVKNNKEAFDLFPDIEIDLNLYTLFIYNEILIQQKQDIELVIQEFEKIKGKESLMNIYQLSQLANDYETSSYYKMLKNKQLFFLDDFINWCKTRDNQKINSHLNIAIKNEDAIQSLCLAFRLFLYYKNQGYTMEKAKKHSGLINDRVFKLVQYVYTHS